MQINGDVQLPGVAATTGAPPAHPSNPAPSPMAPTAMELLYEQGSEWVRMANNTTWAVGSLFIPLSFAPLGYAAVHPLKGGSIVILACGSVALFFSLVFLSNLYGGSARVARLVLMEVEAAWTLPPGLQLYTRQDPVVRRGFAGMNLRMYQWLLQGLLVLGWIVIFILGDIRS